MEIDFSQLKGVLSALELSEAQGVVYGLLLQKGKLTALKLHELTPYRKGILYKILDDLVKMGLVVKIDKPKSVAQFEPAHPRQLKALLNERKSALKSTESTLDALFTGLSKQFNMVTSKPVIQIFEGPDGTKHVSDDSLNAQSDILAYMDNEAIHKISKDYNPEYVGKRKHKQIKKRIIGLDTPYMREHLSLYKHNPFTELRLTDTSLNFQGLLQTYDSTVTFITLDEMRRFGVIIEDPIIANTMRTLLEFAWSHARPAFA